MDIVNALLIKLNGVQVSLPKEKKSMESSPYLHLLGHLETKKQYSFWKGAECTKLEVESLN